MHGYLGPSKSAAPHNSIGSADLCRAHGRDQQTNRHRLRYVYSVDVRRNSMHLLAPRAGGGCTLAKTRETVQQ